MLTKFKLTKKDYFLSSIFTFLTSKAIWLIIICLPFGFLITIFQPENLTALLSISLTGIGLFFGLFFLLVVSSVLSKLRKEQSLLEAFQVLDLRIDGIYYFPNESGKGVFAPFLWKLSESPWHFYLTLTPKHIILIPKREVDKREFRKRARELIINLSKLQALIPRN